MLKKIRIIVEIDDKTTLETYKDIPTNIIAYDFLYEHLTRGANSDKVWAEKIFEK